MSINSNHLNILSLPNDVMRLTLYEAIKSSIKPTETYFSIRKVCCTWNKLLNESSFSKPILSIIAQHAHYDISEINTSAFENVQFEISSKKSNKMFIKLLKKDSQQLKKGLLTAQQPTALIRYLNTEIKTRNAELENLIAKSKDLESIKEFRNSTYLDIKQDCTALAVSLITPYISTASVISNAEFIRLLWLSQDDRLVSEFFSKFVKWGFDLTKFFEDHKDNSSLEALIRTTCLFYNVRSSDWIKIGILNKPESQNKWRDFLIFVELDTLKHNMFFNEKPLNVANNAVSQKIFNTFSSKLLPQKWNVRTSGVNSFIVKEAKVNLTILFEALKDRGIDPTLGNEKGNTALHFAYALGAGGWHQEILNEIDQLIDFLKASGFDENQTNKKGISAAKMQLSTKNDLI